MAFQPLVELGEGQYASGDPVAVLVLVTLTVTFLVAMTWQMLGTL